MKNDPYHEFKQDLDCALTGSIVDPDGAGYVYVISAVNYPYVKIGCARTPMARVRELQVGCFAELNLVGAVSIRNAPVEKAEQAAHAEAIKRGHHIRGEWFECSANEALDCVLTALEAAGVRGIPAGQVMREAGANNVAEAKKNDQARRALVRRKLGID